MTFDVLNRVVDAAVALEIDAVIDPAASREWLPATLEGRAEVRLGEQPLVDTR